MLAAGLAFIAVLLLTLVVLRRRARALRRVASVRRARTAALVGRPAIVIERIANGEGIGCVNLDGEVWTARSLDDDQVIETGTRVDVVEIRGTTALVSR